MKTLAICLKIKINTNAIHNYDSKKIYCLKLLKCFNIYNIGLLILG